MYIPGNPKTLPFECSTQYKIRGQNLLCCRVLGHRCMNSILPHTRYFFVLYYSVLFHIILHLTLQGLQMHVCVTVGRCVADLLDHEPYVQHLHAILYITIYYTHAHIITYPHCGHISLAPTFIAWRAASGRIRTSLRVEFPNMHSR